MQYIMVLCIQKACLLCVLCCVSITQRKKNYMMAGVSAAFASATRIVGCTLIVVLLTDMYVSMYKQHRDEERRAVAAIKAFVKDVISDAGSCWHLLYVLWEYLFI